MSEHAFHARDVDVSPEDVRARHERGEIQLIDVREDYEHDAGRIAGARHIEIERLAVAGGHDRARPPGRLLLPPRRALRDGRQRLPPRRLGGLLDGRRARGVGPRRPAARARGRACRGSLGRSSRSRCSRSPRRRAPPPRRASRASATSTSPIHAASPPGPRQRLFVVEQRGVVRVVRERQTLAAPIPRHLGQGGREPGEGERGLLSIAFPPDYETSGLFYVYLTAEDPRRRAAGARVPPLRRRTPTSPTRRADRLAPGPRRGRQPQRRHARLRARRHALVRHRRRRRGRQPVRPRARPRQPARQAAADRPAARRAAAATRSRPTTRTAPRSGRYGPAQPVPLLLRPPRHEDLFIGDVGQGAREEIDRVRFADGGSAAGATSAGPAARAASPGPDGVRRRARTTSRRSSTTSSAARARSPAASSSATRAADAASAATSTPTPTPAWCARSSPPPRARSTTGPEGLPARQTLVSFGEDACGHVYVVSIAGSVDRVQDGALGACVLRPGAAPLSPPRRPRAPASRRLPDRIRPRVRIADRAPGPRRPPRDAADRADRQRGLPRDGDRARRRGEAQARAHPAARRAPDDPAPAAEPPRRQADPQGAAPPPAADAVRVGHGEGRGRQHRPRAAPHEDRRG